MKSLKASLKFVFVVMSLWSGMVWSQCDLDVFEVKRGMEPSTTYIGTYRVMNTEGTFSMPIVPLSQEVRTAIEGAVLMKQGLCLMGTKHVAQGVLFFAYRAYPY